MGPGASGRTAPGTTSAWETCTTAATSGSRAAQCNSRPIDAPPGRDPGGPFLPAHPLLRPDREDPLQVVAGEGAEREQGLRTDDALNLQHLAGDRVGDRLVVLDARDGHQIVLAGHRIDLGNSRQVHQRLGYLVHLRLLHHQQNDSTHHGIALLKGCLSGNSIPAVPLLPPAGTPPRSGAICYRLTP